MVSVAGLAVLAASLGVSFAGDTGTTSLTVSGGNSNFVFPVATNNHAERCLRGAVIYRKLSLGSQSEAGEQRIARLLTAHTTCRLQQRSLFAYLTHVLTANARGDPIPTLV